MTVSASSGRSFTIGEHITLAYKFAGVLEASQEPNEADMGLGKQLLENVIDALESHGHFARAVTFYELTLTAGTSSYNMPASVSEVHGNGMYIAAGETVSAASGESPVMQLSRAQWHVLTSKDATTDTPTQYFLDRSSDTLVLRIWPTPNEAGTIRLTVSRPLADVDDTSATLDLEKFWNKYLMYALAAEIMAAKTQPADKLSLAYQRAATALQYCQSRAHEHPGSQMYVDH